MSDVVPDVGELVRARTEQLRAALEVNEELLTALKTTRASIDEVITKVEKAQQEVKLRTVSLGR